MLSLALYDVARVEGLSSVIAICAEPANIGETETCWAI
jgi:hypothetical protein